MHLWGVEPDRCIPTWLHRPPANCSELPFPWYTVRAMTASRLAGFASGMHLMSAKHWHRVRTPCWSAASSKWHCVASPRFPTQPQRYGAQIGVSGLGMVARLFEVRGKGDRAQFPGTLLALLVATSFLGTQTTAKCSDLAGQSVPGQPACDCWAHTFWKPGTMVLSSLLASGSLLWCQSPTFPSSSLGAQFARPRNLVLFIYLIIFLA